MKMISFRFSYARRLLLSAACFGIGGCLLLISAWAEHKQSAVPQQTGPQHAAPRPAAPRPAAAQPAPRDVLITGVPHVLQKPDFCGEACAEMYLRKLGYDLDQDFVFEQSGTDPHGGRGCYTAELHQALTRIGFGVGQSWYKVHVSRAAQELQAQWAALYADLRAGIPSIVCMHYDERPRTTEHFRLILGYRARTDEVIYHEPAERQGAYRRMKRARFLRLWPLKYEKQIWTVIRLRLAATHIKPAAPHRGVSAADYAQHVRQLKRTIAGRPFTIVIQPPFVVIGDEDPGEVRERARTTVKWAVQKLKQAFFAQDPQKIIDIWLFKDEQSYRTHSLELFSEQPTTPYGYYSAQHRAMVMNISTGGGTLVHEIVHPFVEADFPRCPAWLNEGLGSLYEQCGEKDGAIHGYTNWRLPGLQKAIRAGVLPSFSTLLSTSNDAFYNQDRGTNYAQARYLCYYLQARGLLRKYYKQFRAGWSQDPTGYRALQDVLGRPDMSRFQSQWEKFVLGLRFP